jgi:hypothetical protein
LVACSLTFLGSFAPRSTDGKDLPLPTRNDRLLLAYLALSAFREARESAGASGDEITRNALEAENLHHWFTRMPWSEGRFAASMVACLGGVSARAMAICMRASSSSCAPWQRLTSL